MAARQIIGRDAVRLLDLSIPRVGQSRRITLAKIDHSAGRAKTFRISSSRRLRDSAPCAPWVAVNMARS